MMADLNLCNSCYERSRTINNGCMNPHCSSYRKTQADRSVEQQTEILAEIRELLKTIEDRLK